MNANRRIVKRSLLLSLLTLPLFLGTCANLTIESLLGGFFDGFNTTLLSAVDQWAGKPVAAGHRAAGHCCRKRAARRRISGCDAR